MKFHTKLLASVLFSTGAATAQATVIDFQDVTSGTCHYAGSSVQSNGYTFTGNPSDNSLYICDPSIVQNNTTAALINANSRSILNMAETGGAAFSLNSFFAGGRTKDLFPNDPVSDYTVTQSIDVIGNLVGGGTVSTSFLLDSIAPYSWSQYTLPVTFTNLVSVMLSAQGSGNRPEFLIDDIVVNERLQVPEPNIFLLIASGLVGLHFLRYRRKISHI